jgi:polyphosphate kinase
MTDQSTTEPSRFINRELSWLEFNQRVLEEARLESHPLLERCKFLSIASSNLDEFSMIRLSGLQQKVIAGEGAELTPDGMSASEQLVLVRKRAWKMHAEIAELWVKLKALLAQEHVYILDYANLSLEQKQELRDYFKREIYLILTPLVIDTGHPFPHISNLSMNLAIKLQDPVQGTKFARMKIPGTLPRLVPCLMPQLTIAQAQERRKPKKQRNHAIVSAVEADGKASCFVWLEQVVAANLDLMFHGVDIIESQPFRITRNADIEIQEDEASDLLRTIEEGIRQRHFGAVARLEVGAGMSQEFRDLLTEKLSLDKGDLVEVVGPVGLADLMELLKLDRPELKDPPLITRVPPELQSAVDEGNSSEYFTMLAQKDFLLHHPYDSFRPVIGLIEAAARDTDVQAIKQTLYRVGSRSPIVRALAQARNDDTQVAVLVELKARFDEENNIEWARELENAGVHVVYGLLGLKTHCKMTLVVRKEAKGLRRYLHLGTGNYNPTTARIYTDFSLMTAREDLADDVTELFNLLTGYSRRTTYRKLLVAPVNMRQRLAEMIHSEAKHARAGEKARLIFKMNALVDPEMIEALYDASDAGVQIDLIVRGICCLRPGVKGLSENVRVISVVGRFLEHSRAYYFEHGGEHGHPALYLGSADLMQRNLDRRVEVLFPIDDETLRNSIRDDILLVTLADTAKSWELLADESWVKIKPKPGRRPVNAQELFVFHSKEAMEHRLPIVPEVKFTPASIFPPLPV